RAAPPQASRREPARLRGGAPVRDAVATPDDGQRRRVRVETPQGRHDYTAAPAAGDGVLCAVASVCPRG
ncbi:MAG TPA: hypothetical protein VNA20_06055, partial [Frankiaceae bacterium]|nr:hypothetical protein [Frankiaceae bacterium]